MPRYKVVIEYDGTNYCGWQKQVGVLDKKKSVQYTLERAIKVLTGNGVLLVGAGRTDAGVHAFGQVAHFDLDISWWEEKLKMGINHFLKNEGIIILLCNKASDDFHARYDCIERSYIYKIMLRNNLSVIDRNRVQWIRKKFKTDLMQEVISCFRGLKNFESLRLSGCQAKSPMVDINFIDVILYKKDENNLFRVDDLSKYDYLYDCKIDIVIKARSFLYRMIRNLVGVLIDVSTEKKSINSLYKMTTSNKRSDNVFASAEPCGLYFLSAKY